MVSVLSMTCNIDLSRDEGFVCSDLSCFYSLLYASE